MKTLYLVRHAKSSWDNPSVSDSERTLNERGLRDAAFMADFAKKQGVEPDRIVTSPARRALMTAAIFGRALGIDEADFQIESTIYHAAPSEILSIVSALPDADETVIVFGHNPTFTDVANRFSKKFIDNVPTCGIVRIEAAVGSWRDFLPENAAATGFFFPKMYLPGSHD